MTIIADVAGHDILDGQWVTFLLLVLIPATVGGIIGWICGYLYRRQRRR